MKLVSLLGMGRHTNFMDSTEADISNLNPPDAGLVQFSTTMTRSELSRPTLDILQKSNLTDIDDQTWMHGPQTGLVYDERLLEFSLWGHIAEVEVTSVHHFSM